jgi:hypothetical protein
LVYDATGIILVKDENGGHPLIPLNLRALKQALDLLASLEVVVDNEKKLKEDSKKTLLRNLHRIEQWLIDSISSNAVPRELANVFRQAAIHPPEGFCAFIVSQLKHYNKQLISEKKLGIFDTVDENIINVLEADAPEKTICLGDIFLLLDKIIERDSCEGYSHFAAAIKMLFSLRATEYLYAYEDSDRESVAKLLGTLIVHPKFPLTHFGSEWRPRGDLSTVEVRIGSEVFRLDSEFGTSSDSLDVKQLEWLSMFLVTSFGILEGDSHKIRGRRKTWSDKVMYRLPEAPVVHVSFHWMRFATAVLIPEQTVNRVLWALEPKLASQNVEKEFVKVLNGTDYLPLPLNSVDLLHALIFDMNFKRQRRSEFSQNTPRFPYINASPPYEYARFEENLKFSLKDVVKNSAYPTDVGEKIVLCKLEKHPIFNFSNAVDVINKCNEKFDIFGSISI